MRTLIVLALVAAGVYLYAERFGLAVGYAPFTPVFYWNYSGEAVYPLRATGIRPFIKVMVAGELRKGSLEVEIRRSGQATAGLVKRYQGRFSDEVRYPVESSLYEVVFRLKGARGQVRMDWVAARNEF